MTEAPKTAVLMMAFGGPETLAEVPPFVESVMGRTPPPKLAEEVLERYRLLGGGSPLPATTRRQAEALGTELVRRGVNWPVIVGMQHAAPHLEESMRLIRDEGFTRVVALSMAPYRSRASTTAYEESVTSLFGSLGMTSEIVFPHDWYDHPLFIQALADRLERTLDEVDPGKRLGISVIFSAHSIPERMVAAGDPYVAQLQTTVEGIVRRLDGLDAHLAFQSVSGAASDPWVGPDVIEVMDSLRANGVGTVVVDPIGFVADHLETLYDNDIVHRRHAEEIGMEFHRCRCLNTDPRFIEALAEIVTGALS